MRVRLERQVSVPAPAATVWDYVTNWERQSEWVPFTHTEVVDGTAAAVGGRLRAWTGLGRVGFWDTMIITRLDRFPDGGGLCEVLHTGAVVRGDGEFAVFADGSSACRFVWAEVVPLPFGRLGAVGWRLVGPVVERLLDRGLRRMARRFD